MGDSFQLSWMVPVVWLAKLAVAVVCGSLVGIERQLRRKTAGMRTNVMICLGSTLYIMAAELIAQTAGAGSVDPTRIAGQVIVGMGFIGAGSIIQSRGRVHGLTTAATLWVVAAVGVLIGIGYPLLAFVVTVLVVFLLEGVGRFEYLVMGKCKLAALRVSFLDQPETWDAVRTVFLQHDAKFPAEQVQHLQTERGRTVCFLEIDYCMIHPDHGELALDLLKLPGVRQTTYTPPTV